MDVLKASWMQEIEVLNREAPIAISETPSSADAEEVQDGSGEFGQDYDVTTGPYPAMYYGEERGAYEGQASLEWRATQMWSA